jgi:hypothetical protein
MISKGSITTFAAQFPDAATAEDGELLVVSGLGVVARTVDGLACGEDAEFCTDEIVDDKPLAGEVGSDEPARADDE